MTDITSTSTPRSVAAFSGPVVVGGAAERARATLAAFPERTAAIAEAAQRADHSVDEPDMTAWARESRAVVERVFPEVAEYLEATADVLGIDSMVMFTRSHRKVVRNGFSLPLGADENEGCSTAAGRRDDVAAWIVKNRDNNQESLERQVVVEHVDPAWNGRRAITVANLGGCMANSSGINTAGFAVVDTAVEVAAPRPGIFRAFLLDGLLGRCTTVEEAVDIIRSVPHLGGTATLADASGAIATADLAPDGAVITFGDGDATMCRTNHFDHLAVKCGNVSSAPMRNDSEERLRAVTQALGDLNGAPEPWHEFRHWLCDQMITHGDVGALCKHDPSGSLTISTVVYGCDPPTMLVSLGPGCVSPWVEWSVSP